MIQRGDIYWVNLDPTIGSEIKKTRLCVVVHRDAAAQNSPLLIVCPLSDAGGRTGNRLNIFVPSGVAGTTKDSIVVVNQIRAVDKTRLGASVGSLPADYMSSVDSGLLAILDLG